MIYLYLITGVPEKYPFCPQNPKEIVEINWFPFDHKLKNHQVFNIYVNRTYGELKDLLELTKKEPDVIPRPSITAEGVYIYTKG